MQYGICNLSIVPLRKEANDTSELVSQVLYGEIFKILEGRKNWIRIRLNDDKCEGWLDRMQYQEITEIEFKKISKEDQIISSDLIQFIKGNDNNELYCIPIGSSLNGLQLLSQTFEGNSNHKIAPKSNLINTALTFLNSPFMWGGKTPFGIDSSGFTQMVYKINGYKLLRDAAMQATQGIALSFIEESETGDLAFFDDSEGAIVHVGIIMEDNYIIHADGKVRIDRLDHSGIYNAERRIHTHKLRVIKKII